ncbi:uncharacterized protein STEHIDRAFT_154357 [Stereum hirsutum FP-91666 SS1]|uniref:uncharacterized protein n=1 Tax=Stereum hirsutum (strain FP-91666) TaxID=721885 RepID=UPI000440F320|nr:uncharacterized protein STEHIDRAFT_154357 [Stereum hirsutum FP-91666 SS1]EIM90539.1 hypothetical protein STEHIDRAFT_154357 [Stereum hirsutum FP-91666 SS1]
MASPDESAATQTASVNTLGLELEQLTVSPSQPDDTPAKEEAVSTPTDPESKDKDKRAKEKEKPYHNPDRVLTGGSQRDKLTEDELKERMTRIREQNEKIKQRRVDVDADERAFKQTQEVERQRQAKTRKVQDSIDHAREQNAQRKMEKLQSREWDSGKKTAPPGSRTKPVPPPAGDIKISKPASSTPTAPEGPAAPAETPVASASGASEPVAVASNPASPTSPGRSETSPRGRGGRGRGAGGRGRGRGRGRGVGEAMASPTAGTPTSPSAS